MKRRLRKYQTPTACVFCGREVQKLNEHPIPEWLQKYRGMGSQAAAPTYIRPASDVATEQIKFLGDVLEETVYRNYVVGAICQGHCNGGWMSRLENETKPILLPLIDGTSTLASLSDAQRMILVKWLIKTSFTYELNNRFRRHIPIQHVRNLFTSGSIPDGIMSFGHISETDTGQNYIEVSNAWLFPMNTVEEDDPHAFAEVTYKTTIHFGRAVISIVWLNNDPRWRLATWPAIHEPVWPRVPNTETPTWTSGGMLDDRNIGRVSFFSLMISDGSWRDIQRPSGERGPRFEHEYGVVRLLWARMNFERGYAGLPPIPFPGDEV